MQPIDFVGFAGDCTISGKMTMFGDRLTDFLNGQERFRIHHVEFESLEDGHKVAIDSVSVVRDDLFAVVATGPRGAEKQRVELQTNRLQISIGPYIILGRLHTKPGTGRDGQRDEARTDDPADERRRSPTRWPARSSPATSATMIVNRMLVDWISPTTDAAIGLPRGRRSARRSRRGCSRTSRPRATVEPSARGERAGPRVVAPRSWAIEAEPFLAGPDARSR